jgi:hypothetical protein
LGPTRAIRARWGILAVTPLKISSGPKDFERLEMVIRLMRSFRRPEYTIFDCRYEVLRRNPPLKYNSRPQGAAVIL